MAKGRIRLSNAENDMKVLEWLEYHEEPVTNPRTGEKHRKIRTRHEVVLGSKLDEHVDLKDGQEPPPSPTHVMDADEYRALLEQNGTLKAWIDSGQITFSAA